MYCGSGGIVVTFCVSVYCVFVLLCLRVFTSMFFYLCVLRFFFVDLCLGVMWCAAAPPVSLWWWSVAAAVGVRWRGCGVWRW
jgi:hypothetical protein